MSTASDEIAILTRLEQSPGACSLPPAPRRRWRMGYFGAVADVCALAASMALAPRVAALVAPCSASGLKTEPTVLLAALTLPLLARGGMYSRLEKPWLSLLRCAALAQAPLLLIALVASALPQTKGAATWQLLATALAFLPLSLAARQMAVIAVRQYRSAPYHVRHVLVIGCGPLASRLITSLHNPEECCCRVVGCLLPDMSDAMGGNLRDDLCRAQAGGAVAGVPVVGTTAELREYIAHHPLDAVLLAATADAGQIRQWADSALQVGLDFGLLPELSGVGRLSVEAADVASSFAGVPMLLLRGVRQARGYLFFKRVFDVTVAATLLTLFAPALALIAAVIKATSPEGPVFYRWAVLGKNRRPFVGYKFRTMVPDADALKPSLMRFNEMRGPVFKMRDDPRITALGRVLRKFSLDELPQLYSVLKGDMSLVGPL